MTMLTEKPKSHFAKLNKNIGNNPLARDRRCELDWRKGKRSWFADIGKIRFSLPLDAEPLRVPSAFDVNVMAILLCEVEKGDSCEIKFRSASALLKAIGYGTDVFNRTRLKDALNLWSQLSIRFGRWYFHREKGDLAPKGTYGRKQLPPLIKIHSLAPRQLCISVDPVWREIVKGYFSKVPHPLPHEAAAQNLVLLLLTSKPRLRPVEGVWTINRGYRRRVRRLCRKIGLNHGRRMKALQNALLSAQAWFKQQGDELTWQWPAGSNMIQFGAYRMHFNDPVDDVQADQPEIKTRQEYFKQQKQETKRVDRAISCADREAKRSEKQEAEECRQFESEQRFAVDWGDEATWSAFERWRKQRHKRPKTAV